MKARLLNYKNGRIVEASEGTIKRWIERGIPFEPIESIKIEKTKFKLHDKVSIVILVKDALEYFKMCLESVIKYTFNYELIIVDNGSSSLTKEYLIEQQAKYGFILITNKENKGFSYGNNQAIKLSTCDYICFLNSDCIVTRNWLARLMEGFEYLNAGIVGPSTCWAGSEQMLREYASRHDTMTLDEINEVKLKPEVAETELMGFCYLVSRKVIDKIGVFDYKRYGIGLSEERDFNWRAREAGFKTYWIKDVYVHHWGSKTFKGMGINSNKFLFKNRAILAKRIKEDPNIFIENDVEISGVAKYDIKRNKKTCVIIPVLNREKETIKTLNSLFENNTNIDVLIVDNGSKNINYLSNFKVRIIKNKTNLGSIRAINQGLDFCNSKYIVIMHNDIIVKIPNWINKSIEFMEDNLDVGAIGIAGWKNIEIIGYPIWSSIITAIDRYNKDRRYMETQREGFGEVAILDGCCTIIRNVGIKLDTIYGYHHFYDIDMSMQYRQRGYRLFAICGSAEHFAEDRKSSTSFDLDYLNKIDMKDNQYYEINRKKFSDKWKNYLPIKV